MSSRFTQPARCKRRHPLNKKRYYERFLRRSVRQKKDTHRRWMNAGYVALGKGHFVDSRFGREFVYTHFDAETPQWVKNTFRLAWANHQWSTNAQTPA